MVKNSKLIPFQQKTILVTGGAGYIGSHVCFTLKKYGFLPVCFDSFIEGHKWAAKYGPVVEGDLLQPMDIEKAIKKYKPNAVIHLASFIQVKESMLNSLKYYENNLIGTVNLLKSLIANGIHHIVFSSTAAVYGNPLYTPIDENHPQSPINTYGKTKHIIELMLQDCNTSYNLRSVSLRYFNAAGAAHKEGLGEAHNPETHLIPLAIRAALSGKPIKIFGKDYNTPDGTCMRDYVHVLDLAEAHIKALYYLINEGETIQLNIGTGIGITNLQILDLIKELFKVKINIKFEERREGDPAILLSNPLKANSILKWKPLYSIKDILQHAWLGHKHEGFTPQ